MKQWPLANAPEAALASFETRMVQEASSQIGNSFSMCSLNFVSCSWVPRFVYCAQKKFEEQRYAESPAPWSPGFLYTVRLWWTAPHSDSSTSLKLQIVLAEEVYNNFEINAKESKNDKRSGLLTPVE